MHCDLCAETNVGPEHEITERHLRNVTLHKFSLKSKQLAGNRHGIVITCSVSSSFTTITDSSSGKISASVKPNQGLQFKFAVKNDCNKESISVLSIFLLHNRQSFNMDHKLQFPVLLNPKMSLANEVCVDFRPSEIGEYKMTIIFKFNKTDFEKDLVIIRNMVVFVEEKQIQHEKLISPFTKEEVTANRLITTHMSKNSSGDLFMVEKIDKQIFASGVIATENMTPEQIARVEEIRGIFETGVTEDNYIDFFHNLLWYEETIVRINLKRYNMSNVELIKIGKDTFGLFVPGLAESRPSLLPGDIIFIKPHNIDEVMFEGIISKIDENNAHIAGLNSKFKDYFKKSPFCDVRFFLSRLSLERMHCAVHMVFKANQKCRIFPVENNNIPVINQITTFYNLNVATNVEQRSAVEHILAKSSGTAPYLIHGPPGTGKTVTIVEAILQLINRNPENRIMVCTDSNMAADHVATLLIKYIEKNDEKILMRANSIHRIWETLPISLEPFSNGTTRSDCVAVPIKDFISYKIVITTLSHAAKYARDLKQKKYNRYITHLFIDEAAQASEPACLIPVCGMLRDKGMLILSGDPKQLGPVVISHNAKKIGLGKSLMERLKENFPQYSNSRNDSNYIVMLKDNYRSDPDILDIPNVLFYDSQLRARADRDPISRQDILTGTVKSRAMVFHGVLSTEQKMGKAPSYFNSTECQMVINYIKCLIRDRNVKQDDIGVITPYKRQVYAIKNRLKELSYDVIEVGTVEAFQGKEKRVIIISTARAKADLLQHDAKFKLGFLVDDKRFNVAITRAKAKVVVIGNPLCLCKDVKWLAYMERCKELGTYLGYNTELTDENKRILCDRLSSIMIEN